MSGQRAIKSEQNEDAVFVTPEMFSMLILLINDKQIGNVINF